MGDELLKLWRETGATVMLITHALDDARAAAVEACAAPWAMPVAIRVNGEGTGWHAADLEADVFEHTYSLTSLGALGPGDPLFRRR